MTTLRRLLVAVYPIRLFVLALTVWGIAADVRAQSPVNVGYYDIAAGAGIPQQVPPIVAAGFTPVLLSNVTAADLAGLHILFVHNPSAMGYAAEYLAGLPAIQGAVNAGMVLIIHDRSVGPHPTMGTRRILPLPTGVPVPVLARVNSNNNSVSDAGTLVANGPGGTVTEMNLDNGNFSNMGFAMLSTLTAPGKKGLLHAGTPNNAVTFSYPLGLGFVIYSSIPLDMFLKDMGTAAPAVRAAFRDIYAPNVLAYAASLQRPPQTTTLTVSKATGEYGGMTALTGTLRSGSTNLTGMTVNFFINDAPVGSAQTDSSGVATLNDVSLGSIGAKTYVNGTSASFAGYSQADASSGTADLDVTKAALKVTADNKSKIYGADLPAFTASYDGFVLGEGPSVLGGTLSFATPATPNSPVGPYAITPYGLTSDNYRIEYFDGTLTVDRTALTVTVADAGRVYHQPNPVFNGTVSGIQDGDAISAVYSTGATIDSPVGTYPINGTMVDPDGRLTNYSLEIHTGTLTIEKAQPVLRFTAAVNTSPFTGGVSLAPVSATLVEEVGGRTLVGQVVTFTQGATSLAAHTDGTGLATAHFALGVGEYALAAAFAGDANYLPAAAEGSQVLYVYQPTQFVIWGGNAPTLAAAVTAGQRYTFWGAQWAKQVTAGSYDANSSFKGYASQAAGAVWTTTGGASSNPPAAIAPYIGVIVATRAWKSGPLTAGNIAEVVVLRVDNAQGYAPNPGHTATGVMVAERQ